VRVRWIFALFIVMALHGAATAGIDDTYVRANPSIWSTDFYVQLIGRNTFRKSFAAVIGIGDYDRFPTLSAPAADAFRVRDFLRDEAGFDQIITLTDDKATYARIAELMEKTIPEAVGQNDRFLFSSAKGMFPDRFVSRDRVRQLAGGRSPGRRKKDDAAD
jgi:hypothetical protein